MAVGLVLLAGCRAPSPHAAAPDRAGAQPAPAHVQQFNDDSYDWHGLLVAPFGSVLKDIPVALHEVLLFRDEARGGAAFDDAECYASDAPAPRFVGRVPDEYLLCFKQDRLVRVQASVHLPAAEAPEVFAAACSRWQNARARTGAEATDIAPPGAGAQGVAAPGAGTGAEAQNAAAPIGAACEGRDGPIRYSAHLGEDAGRADTPQTEGQPLEAAQTVLSIKLDSSPDR
jgi:hypothetical protein